EGVHRKAPGARLGHRALQHLLAARAPQLHLHAVLLLESLGDVNRVLALERGVHRDLLLLLRRLQQALVAVLTLVHVQLAMRSGRGLRRSKEWRGQRRREEKTKRSQLSAPCQVRDFTPATFTPKRKRAPQ